MATDSAGWQPNETTVKELTSHLRNALNAQDAAAQKQATLALTQAMQKEETARYLSYILAQGPRLDLTSLSESDITIVRCSAAINLKNIIKANYTNIHDEIKSYIRQRLLLCIGDENRQVRKIVGTVIAEIIKNSGVISWPDLFPLLLSNAANDGAHVSLAGQEGAMEALSVLCEDGEEDLDQEYSGERPLAFILSRLLQITASPQPRVRAGALACINSFIPRKSSSLISALDTILDRLFTLAQDQDREVRRNLCRSLVLIVDIRPDKILPHMEGLVEYLCTQQRNTNDPDSALEAAEFWLAVGENIKVCPNLEPHLSKIVPVLLDSMVYDEEAILQQSYENDDADEEDRTEDIKPIFASSKGTRNAVNGHQPDDDALSDGEIAEDDLEDDFDLEEQWTLRKCSAAALDVLASNFHQLVFNLTLEYLNRNLTHTEWPYREAAVLAMGAVAEGCLDAVAPALPNVVPYLITLLNDKEAPVRVITCWALGRYSVWAVGLEDAKEREKYFDPILRGLLDRMLDKSKRVQTAAASAFANLGEKAGRALLPHCEQIIKTFVACFDFYKDRNMYVLYDCVQTLADQIGPSLREPNLLNLLMPALIQRWNKVSDQSQELFPLHECLSYIASALGDGFAPFAEPTFDRCIRIIRQNLEQGHLATGHADIEKPDKDFLVTSLDLLSGIIQALDPSKAATLVQNSEPKFFDLLLYCLQDSNNDVRQSAYALLGDCAVNISSQMQSSFSSIVPVLIQQLDVKYAEESSSETAFSVINNACWSCGEIAMRFEDAMGPYVADTYHRLKRIIDRPQIPVSVGENAVIAIGRLGVFNSSILAPHLGEFINQFLNLIAPVDPTDEKAHAFFGLNRTIKQNPYAMGPCLLQYISASLIFNQNFVGFEDRGESIGASFQQVLEGYKRLNPDYFSMLEGQLPHPQLELFRSSYNL